MQKRSVLRKRSAQNWRGVVWRAATGGMRTIEENVDECLETGHGADSRFLIRSYLGVLWRFGIGMLWNSS